MIAFQGVRALLPELALLEVLRRGGEWAGDEDVMIIPVEDQGERRAA